MKIFSKKIVLFCILALLIEKVFPEVYINKPYVMMREAPDSNSKVDSSACFSEKVSVEKKEKDWSLITTSDGNKGWVKQKFLIENQNGYDADLKVTRLYAHLYDVKDTEWGPFLTVSYGTMLKILDDTNSRWVKVLLPDGKSIKYIQKGDVEPEKKLTTKEELVSFSENFFGLPYIWGGRTSFGYDCSGFIQMLYSQIGIILKRHARFQILDKRFKTTFFEDLEPGDLIFFGKSEKQIKHVGMYIGKNKFIHATVAENKPWIRISDLNDLEWSGKEDANYHFRVLKKLK